MAAKDTPALAEKLPTVPDPELEWHKLDESAILEGDLSVSGMGFDSIKFLTSGPALTTTLPFFFCT